MKKLLVLLVALTLTGCVTTRGEQIKSVIIAKKIEIEKSLLRDGKVLLCTAPADLVIKEYGTNAARWTAWQEVCLEGRTTPLDLGK